MSGYPRLHFSDSDLSEMKRLYALGWSTAAIGKRFGCLGWSVCIRLRALGVTMRPPSYRPVARVKTSHGYITVGGEYEHRLVAEAKLGRALRLRECVHHKNGDKTDNRPENLEVFSSNGQHITHCHDFQRWTPEMQTKMLKLRKRGATAAKIAQSMGISTNSVNNRIYRLRRRGEI